MVGWLRAQKRCWYGIFYLIIKQLTRLQRLFWLFWHTELWIATSYSLSSDLGIFSFSWPYPRNHTNWNVLLLPHVHCVLTVARLLWASEWHQFTIKKETKKRQGKTSPILQLIFCYVTFHITILGSNTDYSPYLYWNAQNPHFFLRYFNIQCPPSAYIDKH